MTFDTIRRAVMAALDMARPNIPNPGQLHKLEMTVWFNPRTGEASNVEVRPTYKGEAPRTKVE